MNLQKKIKLLNVLSLVFNVALVVMVACSISQYFTGVGSGNMTTSGFNCLRYYTNLSNILVAITALIIIPFNVISIIRSENAIPSWAVIAKFIGTVSVSVTFLTVIFFLGPTQGYGSMFAGNCLYLHLIVPVFAIISFVIFECQSLIKLSSCYVAVSSTLIYSIVYVIAVVIAKIWQDFYGFTFGGKLWVVPISMIVMYIATFLIALGLRFLRNFSHKKLFLKQECSNYNTDENSKSA